MCKIRWYHILLSTLAILLIIYFFFRIRGILPPFIIALIIAWLLDPIIDKLESRKWPRLLAVSFVFVIFLAIFTLGMIFLIPAVIDQAKLLAMEFPKYLDKSQDYVSNLFKIYKPTLIKFELPTTFQDVMNTFENRFDKWLTDAIKIITNWITSNLSKALWIFLVPLVSFYYLNDIDKIKLKTTYLIPEQWRLRTTQLFGRVSNVFSNYVRGLLIVCMIYGITTGILMAFVGVRYSILIGLFAGVLYAVPYIGTFITALLAFLIAMATHNTTSLHPVWIPPTIVLVMNQAFDLFISPKILGKSVGLHPILSLFAMLAGGQLFGLTGLIIAVPLAASIQEIVFEIYPVLKKTTNELHALKNIDDKSEINNSIDSEIKPSTEQSD